MRARPLRTLSTAVIGVVAGAALAACGPADTAATGGSSSTAAAASAPASATVLQQADIPGSAAATATQEPVAAGSLPTTPTARMKYGESMGYALPATKDWATALEVRVSETTGMGPGWFQISIANRTGSPFDLQELQIRAVDSAGKTIAQLEKTSKNEVLFRTLPSPSVVISPFSLPVKADEVSIWVQPSQTGTQITSWSTSGR